MLESEGSSLLWLDELEKKCKSSICAGFKDEVGLLEKQINVISAYVNEIGKTKSGTGLTIGELKRSKDDKLLSSMVPAFLVFQAMDSLQATRLNMLHGYLSVSNACLRNVAEALRWADAAGFSAEVARQWLNSETFKKPTAFVLAPPVQEMMKLFDRLSKGGSHPLAVARSYSALAKSEARKLISDENYKAGMHSCLDLANQVSGDFLLFLVGKFPEVLQGAASLGQEVNKILGELDTKFGIKVVPPRGTMGHI